MASSREDPCLEETQYQSEEEEEEEEEDNSDEESWETDSSSRDDKSWESDTDSDDNEPCSSVDAQSGHKTTHRQPCKYYNQGHCKEGEQCTYLHVCQYYFRGNCKYGLKCKFKHSQAGHRDKSEPREEKQSRKPSGKHYEWRIHNGKKWSDIDNDFIIEAQYSLPEVNGMKIYNSSYGAIAIDFNKMRVRGKDLRVQRKTFQDAGVGDKWLWYFRGDNHWKEYDGKDSKGNRTDITSAAIEKKYQQNKRGSYQFKIGSKSYKISFKEMIQINLDSNTKRKVRRRPAFTLPKTDGNSISKNFKALNLSGKPTWQFKGDHGEWHDFKQRKGESASITSDDIEAQYKRNRQGSIKFSIGSTQYQLDFSTMIQTNLSNNHTRKVRRL